MKTAFRTVDVLTPDISKCEFSITYWQRIKSGENPENIGIIIEKSVIPTIQTPKGVKLL